MSKFDPDRADHDKRKKHKNPKFRDYYDEDFSEDDEVELYKLKRKLGKKPKRPKSQENDWPAE